MKLPNELRTPVRLQMLQWIVQPFALMKSCTQRYGDIFTLQVGPKFSPLVLLSNPEAIKQIFTGDSKQFDSGSANHIFELIVGKNSLLLMDGDRHRRERRLLTPPFHGERMQTYGQLICQIAEQVTSHWTIGKPFSVRSAMREISLQVILQCVFGLYKGLRYQQLKELLGSMLDVVNSPKGSSLRFLKFLRLKVPA